MKTDNLYLYALMHELSYLAQGARIGKIHQPTYYELVFHLRTKQGNKKLLMSVHPETFRFHLTTHKLMNPQHPKNFAVVLRKYLVGGVLVGLEQLQQDRIVCLSIQNHNAIGDLVDYKLYIELMGKYSNIVLVDAQGMIIDTFKKIEASMQTHRILLPKLQYELPKKTAEQKDFPFYLQPFLQRWLQFHDASPKRLLIAANNPQGYYYKLAATQALYSFVDLDDVLKYKEKLSFATLSEAIDVYYYEQTIAQQLKEKTAYLLRFVQQTLKRNERKYDKLQQEYALAQDYEGYQLRGNLLLAHQHTLAPHQKEVRVANYYATSDETISIALDEQKTVSENAQAYFKKYTKAKRAIVKLQEQLTKTAREIAYFETISQSLMYANLQQAEEIHEELSGQGYLKNKNNVKKAKRQPQYAQYVYNDITYLVGKNNLQNDYITFKQRRKDYLWLHVKDAPGAHVLILKKMPLDEAVILGGALLAAYFSKMRESENVAVDYTLVQHVKKPSGAKPGYVIYQEQKTLYVTPSLTNLQKYFHDFV